MKPEKNIKWIGLAMVTVIKDSDIFNGDKSAYTNAVGVAKTKAEFRHKVKMTLYSMNLKLLRLEDAAPLGARRKNYLSKEVTQVARALVKINEVKFSTFHTFSE